MNSSITKCLATKHIFLEKHWVVPGFAPPSNFFRKMFVKELKQKDLYLYKVPSLLYLFSGRQFRFQIQTLFTQTLFFLTKSRILVENSTAPCFEAQETVNFHHK